MIKIATFLLALALSSGACAGQRTISIPIHKRGASTFYVKARLGDLNDEDFMVDTGSGYLIINQASLARLKKAGQADYQKNIKAILANGEEFVVQVWRISSFTLSDQCVLHDVAAAVFPGDSRQIIGLTVLERAAPIILSFDPPHLVLSHCAGGASASWHGESAKGE